MENASKALIIAGAILLSIVIISLGLVVVNNTRDTINNANTNKEEVAAFNSDFEHYVGSNKTVSDVKAVCAAAFASNGAQNQNNTNHKITVKKGSTTLTSLPTDLTNAKKYTISVGYANDGYVNAITITETNA